MRAKSTNVRVGSAKLTALRLAFAALNHVPAAGAALAERLFFTPPRPPARVPAGAERVRLGRAPGVELAAWTWGSGPAVLLLHGWGGSSAQFAELAQLLAARGFRAVALDAPGHGLSGGRTSSLPEFSRAALLAARELGPFHGVVGHSMGGAALALALRDGLQAAQAVFVGAPRNPVSWTRRFAAALGIDARVVAAMQDRSERRLGFRWEELDVAAIAPRMTIPLLVVHDRDDREVPFAEGEALAALWPAAELVTTSGLGHNRILRDAGVNARVAACLAASVASRGGEARPTCANPGCERSVPEPGLTCGVCAFEQELFDRELRFRRRATAAA